MLKLLKNFFYEEDGLGTVEIIVIIAVLVVVALIFKDQISKFVINLTNQLFNEKSIGDEVKPADRLKDKN